jgi:hypothetical protein
MPNVFGVEMRMCDRMGTGSESGVRRILEFPCGKIDLLLGRFVLTGRAAGFAVQQAVVA